MLFFTFLFWCALGYLSTDDDLKDHSVFRILAAISWTVLTLIIIGKIAKEFLL